MASRFAAVLSAWLGVCALPGSDPAQPPAAPPALQPCDDCVPGVENFAKVSEALWRGAQPSAEGFRALEQLGARTVVSFRQDHDDLEGLKGTRLKYLSIPSRAFRPTRENLVRLLKVLEDRGNWPVFIHCAQGRDRTGYHVAAYRMTVDGWSAEKAIEEMHRFRFNRVWILNPGFLRGLDPEQLRDRIRRQPKPQFVVWVP